VNQLLVSFIIPVLNGERNIGRCLTSILSQRFDVRKYEIIVADNGSTDQTQRIVRDLGVFMQITPGVNVGTLRNKAARIARGDYLAFVDSDVEIMPNWLEKGLFVFNDKSVVSTGCFPRPPLCSTWVQRTWEIHQRGRRNSGLDGRVSWLPSMNMIVRRDAFAAIGGFNENLVTAEDVDLCYRLKEQGAILRNLDMDAIHWGEAPDLKTFWRKEVWRGLGTPKGILSHGLCFSELPSIGYPLYIICVLMLFILCLIIWDNYSFKVVGLSIALLTLPATTLAVRTTITTQNYRMIPQLFLLYLVYGVARAYSMIRPNSITGQRVGTAG
jgi:glycosyltransferase involved in cell wall biosynthesis